MISKKWSNREAKNNRDKQEEKLRFTDLCSCRNEYSMNSILLCNI